LGQRTAEMHRALANAVDAPAFTPEPIVAHYRRGRVESFRNLVRSSFLQLRRQRARFPETLQPEIDRVLSSEGTLVARVRALLDRRVAASRIRVHGDYHLGQVLFTGKDFVILDFEGEPARSLGERRYKRTAMRDLAGMLRSFEYAVAYALRHGPGRAEDLAALRPWGRLWSRWVSAAFLQGYLAAAEGAVFLPDAEGFHAFLEYNLLDKTVYELRYELNNRPDWVEIPLDGILEKLGEGVGVA
ncbi:MAG TPA: phosphotransferase, partial [Gemmatimonadales bacterium]|nr:phosphotransferase [Gemmatimonadales bacterium]